MIRERIRFLGSLSVNPTSEWHLAVRYNTGKRLFEGNNTKFYPIKNTQKYWFADPFLFEYRNKHFVFCEMYDRKEHKGVLEVAELDGLKCKRFKLILDLPYHLSYPCVFEHDGKIFMIPECYQSGRIILYICTKFPYEWEEYTELAAVSAVDTTPLKRNAELIFLTTIFSSTNERINDNLYELRDGNIKCLFQHDFCKRSAGHIIIHNNKIIRPSQDCRSTYGGGLVYNEVAINDGVLSETKMLEIFPPDYKGKNELSISLYNSKKHRYTGIHTYNSDSKYEIIDLKYNDRKSIVTFINNFKCYLRFKFLQRKKTVER